jgi:hypothetical protein
MSILNEALPCDECEYSAKCKRERLACTEFEYYINTGNILNWKFRFPTRAIFYATMYNPKTSIVTKVQKAQRATQE